jgi:hypothetical protein
MLKNSSKHFEELQTSLINSLLKFLGTVLYFEEISMIKISFIEYD